MVNHLIPLTPEEINQCKDFANKSSPTQREHRSGGQIIRSVKQIYDSTFRGKMGEIMVKKFLEKEFNIKNIVLNFNIYPRGKWDSTDININKTKISIKTSKHFSNWLLLESKDINRGDIYDYYILVLVDKDLKSGKIKGFVRKNEIIQPAEKTLLLKQDNFIPNTQTPLDADNHARHIENLHNSAKEWGELVNSL